MARKKLQASKKKTTPGKRITKKLITWVIILFFLVIGGYAAYSVYTYQTSDEEQAGFFVCDKTGKICELSQHIHADIEMNICGKEIEFPKEKGRTDRQHTHKEQNKIHWHERLRVDPATKQPLDETILTVKTFFQQMEYTLPTTCPENVNPTLTVTVNNQEMPEKLDYIWKDGDTITVELK